VGGMYSHFMSYFAAERIKTPRKTNNALNLVYVDVEWTDDKLSCLFFKMVATVIDLQTLMTMLLT